MPKAQHKSRAHSARGKQHEPAHERSARPRPFWSGTLSFGLVSVPVDLHPATRAAGVSLRMLAPDGTPLARRYFCPDHDRALDDEDLVRGFEYQPGEYVVVSDEELEALDPEKTRDIDLRRFVDAASIAPAHFEHAYVLSPAGDSNKAYRLLAHIMEQERVAGIATFVLRDRERVVAIFADHGVLRAQTLRFVTELRPTRGLDLPPTAKADAAALRAFAGFVHKHTSRTFDPGKLEDREASKLRELAERKRKHGEAVTAPHAADAEQAQASADMLDLMRLLKESLAKRR